MPSDKDYVNTSASLHGFPSEITRSRADDREYDPSHLDHGVHAHPVVAVRDHWSLGLERQGWSLVSAIGLFGD